MAIRSANKMSAEPGYKDLVSNMNRAYGVLSWGIIALGALHMAATWSRFHDLTPAALWFFNGGIVLVFTGVLNLINRAQRAEIVSLRWFCRSVNVVMLCFATIAGIVGGASLAQLIVVIGLLGAIAGLSITRAGSHPRDASLSAKP
jgi:glucose uptake protein GlcU